MKIIYFLFILIFSFNTYAGINLLRDFALCDKLEALIISDAYKLEDIYKKLIVNYDNNSMSNSDIRDMRILEDALEKRTTIYANVCEQDYTIK